MFKIPKFILALLADIVVWLLLVNVHAHQHLCPTSGYFSCYINFGDRYSSLLGIVAVVATILIPIAIVLWGDQFQANSLKESSLVAKEWRKERKSIYLSEIVGGLAVLILISLILPLYLKSNAIFWCAVLYGIYVLVYAFYVAFYKDPVDVYELKPIKKIPIDVDMGRELITFTVAQNPSQKSNDNDGTNQLWQNQLSDERTFKAIEDTVSSTLNSDDQQIRFQWWAIWRRFLISCDVDSLITELTNGGVLSKLLSSSVAYKKENVEFTSSTFNHVASRLSKDRANADFIPEMYKLVPTRSTSELDSTSLYNLYMPSFRTLFNATSTLNDDALLYFPDKWKVSMTNLNRGKANTPRATATIYRNWVRDVQKYSAEPNEDAVITTTEIIFPKSSTWIISMYIKLWNNFAYFDADHPEYADILNQNLGRWKLYGHVGRVNTDWTDVATGIVTTAGRNALGSDNDTFDLIEKLGWINSDSAISFVSRINGAIDLMDNDSEKAAWREFSELLTTWLEYRRTL